MRWLNFFHIYQPPQWSSSIIRKVSREAYRPLVRFLLSHPTISITLNISGSLTEQLAAMDDQHDIIAGLRVLIARKQIEPTDSAMYHAILPLLPETSIERQIKLNRQTNRRLLGPSYKPTGFFPPEMAYSKQLGSVLQRLGYAWVMLDGISHPGIVDYTVRSLVQGTKITAIFRNRFMSDYLAFEAQLRDQSRFLQTARKWDGQSSVLITGMDGENLGHHRPEDKKLWQTLVQLPEVKTVTASELIRFQDPAVVIRPRSASWSSQSGELKRNIPFALWRNPSNQLHILQWQLFSTVMRRAQALEKKKKLPQAIRRELDQSVASDWYWWASQEPWWDVDIIVNAATKFDVLSHELGFSRPEMDRVDRLVRDIISTARRWHATGAAQRHATRFLRHQRAPRYLGGNKIHYSTKHS